MSAIHNLLKKIKPKHPLYVQIFFTVFSFATMVTLSYIFASDIVRGYLKQNMDTVFNSVEGKLLSDLMEPQMMLDNFSHSVQRILINEKGVDKRKLKDYFNEISDYLSSGKDIHTSFNGFIGHFETLPEGPALIESFAWTRPADFDATKRPWYTNAVAANGKIAETMMYNDEIYGSVGTMLIYSSCILDDNNRRLGVVGLRVRVDTIAQYVVNVALSHGAYGILISKELVVLAHTNPGFIGRSVSDPEIPFSLFTYELEHGIPVGERELMSYTKEPSVAFFKRLSNGWTAGVVTPKTKYYQSVNNMAKILLALGVVLASVLIIVLIRVDMARNESEMRDKYKSTFLANMSHEIRTPMNAIMGMTDLLLYEPLNKKQLGFVNDIKVSARSLLDLINDILDMSKIESGKLELNPINYDFHALLDNVSSMFKYVAQKKNLEFFYEVEGQMPGYLYGDDIRVRQILTNLCSNAVKYTERGSVKFKVSMKDNFLVFEIKDTGMGIRKEDLPKLFTTFQRFDGDKNRAIVGTGLGLSICKSFTELMGGKILVDSEYEQGSVFTVMIPCVVGDKSSVKLKRDLTKTRTMDAHTANILVVDDNEFNIRVAEGLLGLFKIKAQVAFSGPDAIDLVKKNRYDIVFMDHMMPEMDGVEATNIIRKLGGRYKHMPIIALTANAVEGARDMFLSHGFDGFISKPIDMQEMYGMLKEWLPPEKITEETVKKAKDTEDDTDAADDAEDTEITEVTESADQKIDFMSAIDKVNEINTEIGLERVSGMENMYQETVELFYKGLLTECNTMSDKLNKGDLKSFSISIHAMKSALATIGAMSLSEKALKLETASKEDDKEYCLEHFPVLKENLLTMHEELSLVFPGGETKAEKKPGDSAYLLENIEKSLSAASDFDGDTGLEIINDLLTYDFGEKNNALLEDAAAAFKEFNYDAATEILNKINA